MAGMMNGGDDESRMSNMGMMNSRDNERRDDKWLGRHNDPTLATNVRRWAVFFFLTLFLFLFSLQYPTAVSTCSQGVIVK
jgi:hypothetical protein